ncbi:MAG: GDSL-type esterase/lipase family protein [Oculatellaceae cyanobacterium bins.114]|nr:GDSL-type esterase/lipase family protein [Oculatellaceae cyanobacterium bins.114]
MGDLSLLAVSLLHHSSVTKQQIPVNLAIATVTSASAVDQLGQDAIGQTVVSISGTDVSTYAPEFSSTETDLSDPSMPGQLTSEQSVVNQPIDYPEEQTMAQSVSPLQPRSLQRSPQSLSRPSATSTPLVPQTSTIQPIPTWIEPSNLPNPEFSDPNPAATLSTPRPSSGSQLYRQRTIALRSGRTYTRLPANSYWESWVQATQQPTYEQWVSLLSQEAGAMARGQGSNRLTVLLGDSLYLWYPPERLASDRFWLNQGISGDTTTGVLRRLSAFAQTRPDTIHVMVGINDLRRGATDAEVINNSRQIMRQLRRNHPRAQIIIHSILPTRLAAIPSGRIHHINNTIAAIAKQEQVEYLDLLNYFADAQGNLRRDLTTDGLHLNPRGYATWQWAMAHG